MEKDRLRALLTKYVANATSADELDELLDQIVSDRIHPELEKLMIQMLEETEANNDADVDGDALYQRIVSHRSFTNRKKVRTMRNWWWYGSAAVLLLAFSVWMAGWRVFQNDPVQHDGELMRTVTTSPSERPLLRLADGRTVELDSVVDGLLAIESGIHITLQGNSLHYRGEFADGEEGVPTNTIVIPKGRQYQIELPDGSKLWLNAASSLTYPIRFGKDRREVELLGEAYFEVKHAADWPFAVTTPMHHVEVLGTHFNVSAYQDDNYTKTTLVEGRVKVTPVADPLNDLAPQSVVLTPGQQVSSRSGQSRFTVNSVDPEEIISWKDHLFVFSNEEISEVMKKVSRWYDVEIEYLDGMAGKRIGGSIPRLTNVEELMEALKDTGLLHYKMEGGRIVIMK
ncbi:FecR family protein [Parapedobacter sp. 2B3]|uniref:FecR family protein n=1 Tax=Parapedobacter sp. 2B3 TaxID=3342381 RepID=UPI0035B63D34